MEEGRINITKRQEENNAYQSVHGLISSFTSFETVVHLVGPRAHLNGADKVGVDDGFFVQAG
jgi:hypothetical protein